VRVNNVETYRESCAARGGCHGPNWTAKLKQFGAWMVATLKLLRIHSEVACLLVFADASRGRNSSLVTELGNGSAVAFFVVQIQVRVDFLTVVVAPQVITWKWGSRAVFRSNVNVWEQPAQTLSAPIKASSNSPVPRLRAKAASKTCCSF